MLLLLNREGMAGMCGVWGEMGLPGEEEVEIEPGIMPGTFCSWRLDELEDLCRTVDDCIDSVSWPVESRIRENLLYCVAVRCELALNEALSVLLRLDKPLFLSSSLRKSAMLSSSPCTEPELAPPSPSWSVLDSRLVDETLALPLLLLSSSTLLLETEGNRALLLLKLDAYLWMGAGLGELDAEEPTAVSATAPGLRKAIWGSVDSDDFLACASSGLPALLPMELLGELERKLPAAGDDDKEPALKGWNETEGLRWMPIGCSDEGAKREASRSLWLCEE
jgi:hypothetical protein